MTKKFKKFAFELAQRSVILRDDQINDKIIYTPQL